MSIDLSTVNIRMTSAERSAFERLISQSQAYLEYGCGGSTEIASQLAKGVSVSIESDGAWVSVLKEKAHIQEMINRGRMFIEHVDVGPVKEWGAPKDDSKIRNWPTYFIKPFTQYDFTYDLILIDGRFRNSCAYAVHALASDDVTVAFHDYVNRPEYYDIEKFYEIVDKVDTLIVLRKKRMILQKSLYMSLFRSIFSV